MASDLRSSTLFPAALLEDLPRPRRRLLQVGGFAILPSVALATAYDDNADAGETDREDDVTANLSGTLRAESLFPRHNLGLEVGVRATPFAEDDDNDSLFDWVVGADGRLDLTRHSSLSAAATFTRGTESAESPEAVESPEAAEEPTTITSVAGTATYARQGRLLGWRIGGGVSRLEAEDDGAANGFEIDERNRTGYTVFADADYPVSRRLSAFVDSGYTFTDFDEGTRDSQSVRGDVGVSLAIGRELAVRVGVGYSRFFLDDPERDDTQTVTALFGLDGVIRAGGSTVVTLAADHSIEPVAVEEAASATTTRVSAGITRPLSRASAVGANVSYIHRDFNDIERTDHDIIARLSYSRTLTQSINLNISYRFSQRFSDEQESEFYRNIVSIGLSAAF